MTDSKIQDHFDVNRIVGIRIIPKRKTSHKWLPEKRKTLFFGLIKRNSFYREGFYDNGCYQECYESGCWDATPSSTDRLRDYGYLVEGKEVFHKPHVTVYLEHELQTTRSFDNIEKAREWVEELKATSGKTFEIVEK